MSEINQRESARNSVTRNLHCANCGREIWHRSGRRPRFCSDRCRNREIGRRRVRKSFLGTDTRAPAKHQKTLSNFNALQTAKSLSSHPIFGPPQVFEVEVFGGREWRSAMRSAGIALEIGHIRRRALVESFS
jgi:endogenous inhibitor of DNA gyrase (YacG/DUF329 family)